MTATRDALRFRMLFANAPIGLSVVDTAMRYIQVNDAMCILLGYAREEMVGHRFMEFTHPQDVEADLSQTRAVLEGRLSHFRMDKRYFHRDGSVVWARVTVSATAPPGEPSGDVISMVEDITAMKPDVEDRRRDDWQRRNTLVREVQHRIKNNLQGVIGLLHQHAYKHPDLKAVMDKAISKVSAIALVHGLHSDDAANAVNLCNITREVAHSVAGMHQSTLELELPEHFVPVEVHPDETVPIALIINELVQNAFNHSPTEADRSLIRIKVWRSGDSAVVSVENNCLALPRDFSFERGQGIDTGLSLVKSLMPRAGAELEFRLDDHQILCAQLRLSPPVVFS